MDTATREQWERLRSADGDARYAALSALAKSDPQRRALRDFDGGEPAPAAGRRGAARRRSPLLNPASS